MNGLIPTFDPETGALPPGDHQATLEEIGSRLGFTPRRRWLLKGLRAAFEAFWNAGIEEIYIDGFCPEKPETGDVDGYWVEADLEVYDRVDPYWIDFTPVFVGTAGKCRSRMSADHGVEFFSIQQATPEEAFPEFFRHDRAGRPRGVVRVMRSEER